KFADAGMALSLGCRSCVAPPDEISGSTPRWRGFSPLPATAGLQDIELQAISQRVVGRHGQVNPAAKVRGRNDMADRWSASAKESSPIAPAEDEAAGGTGIVMRRTGSWTQAEHYREMVVDP